MSSCKVYYIIPDDGDDEAHPNMFTIPLSQQQIKLKDIRAHFPLKRHAYHFRFKKAFQNKYVWLDCIDQDQSIPAYEGVLFCKAARLGESSGNFAQAATVQAQAVPQQSSVPTSSARKAEKIPASQVPFVAVEGESELFEWTDMPASSSATAASFVPAPVAAKAVSTAPPAPANSASVFTQSDDLLDFLGSAPSASPPPAVSGMEDFEWDSSAFQSAAPVAASSHPSVSVSGFPGVGAPMRTISPANTAQTAAPAKKPSTSRLPNELGAEAAKQFTL
jgi:hypothetical protein